MSTAVYPLELLTTDQMAEADRRTIGFIGQFLAGLGLDKRLRDCGVQSSQLETLVSQAVDDPCHRTNVVPVSREDFQRLYAEVY